MMLIRGDARALPLAAASVQCVVTSPPYWGLRDYGRRHQLGLEATPDAYVAALVAVFREVWRVLADDGTCWLNLGDSYCGSFGAQSRGDGYAPLSAKQSSGRPPSVWGTGRPPHARVEGLKAKDLIGIPWRVAFALQADGWYLRADIIWAKPNPMPESVRDRPTKAHEHLFLLAKAERYHYDAAAIAEPCAARNGHDATGSGYRAPGQTRQSGNRARSGSHLGASIPWAGSTRNARSVWTVTTQPYKGAHFATMPEQLVEPCILAGCPPGGIVLDPFVGSGTVCAVAQRLGRRSVGIDLRYQDLARRRGRVA